MPYTPPPKKNIVFVARPLNKSGQMRHYTKIVTFLPSILPEDEHSLTTSKQACSGGGEKQEREGHFFAIRRTLHNICLKNSD